MSQETKTDLSRDAETLLEHLLPYVSGERDVTALADSDRTWLSKLAVLLDQSGSAHLQSLPLNEGGVSIDVLNPAALRGPQGKALLEKLYYSLRAMLAAYKASPQPMGESQESHVVIHNREVAEKLQGQYSSKTFEALFSLCQERGVFALKINGENGLVTTAEAEENWDMSGRQWVTDTVRCGDIERSVDPHAWTKAMLTLCDFYHQDEEMEAIRQSVADPDYYRAGGLLNGVAHIFIPYTLKRDTTWFNNKRLESHGLALRAICDTVVAGVTGGEHADSKKWGFTSEQLAQHGEKIAQTIVCLAAYLKSINTDKNGRFDFGAQSAGPWEEIPFPDGLTWDTEAIRSGFESLKTLLFGTAGEGSKKIEPLRRTIVAHEFGQWLQDATVLDQLMRQARGKIIDRLFGQLLPVENPQRPLDCSLAFIATSTVTFADDVISDVIQHYMFLKVIEEKLVRSHGIIRYAPFNLTMEDGHKEPVFDAYLADNYWLLPELRAMVNGISPDTRDDRHFGSSDCSSHDDYLARVKMARSGSEAQWCFVSVLAEAYCLQVQKLLKLRTELKDKKGGQVINEKELEHLIEGGTGKAGDLINRSFARITGPNAVKTNGRDCPAWAIPEAYELVSPIGPNCGSQSAFLPGANTPLAWGQASLYRACELFREILAAQGL